MLVCHDVVHFDLAGVSVRCLSTSAIYLFSSIAQLVPSREYYYDSPPLFCFTNYSLQ